MTISLSKTGEVADFQDVDQFQPAKTQFACGFFSVAIVKAMGQVGKPPTQTVPQMIAEALQWYQQYDGDPSWKNTSGMELWQLYNLIVQVGLHYQATDLNDKDLLRAWLRVGYPVIVAVTETSVSDMLLGGAVVGKNPYPWNPAGTHVIVLTGVHASGNFLVRDPANCTNLYDPNSLRPGPRVYDAAKLQLVSATVVVPPWMPRPPAGFDPRKETSMNVVPLGWHDDGTTLVAPNGHKVVLGFRSHVLANNWNKDNQPLEDEHGQAPVAEGDPTLGNGTAQSFRDTTLAWTSAKGVFELAQGQELLARRTSEAKLAAEVAQLTTQVATFQNQQGQQSQAVAVLKKLQPDADFIKSLT